MKSAYLSRIVTGVGLIAAVAVAVPTGAAAQNPQTATATSGKATVPPDDDALESKIEDILRKDSVLAPRDIDVEADRGQVTLTGSVRTADEKARAARLAKITGVTTVVNELEVNPKSASRIDTAASKTKEGLNKAVDATAKAAEKTKEGVQRGVAETEKGLGTAAGRTADALDKAGDKMSDTAVSTRVKTGFSNDATLKNVAIRVEAKDRIVTLRGTVPTAAVKARAEEVAAKTDGVVRVVNELVVEGK